MATIFLNVLIFLFASLEPSGISYLKQILGMDSYSVIHYVIVFYLCVLAPLSEEYIFRGLLWNFLEKIANKKFAYLTTTILFSLVHLEFLHVIAVLPLSVFFGGLKYKYNLLSLPIAAHVINNIVATIILIY
jgi:membrane protease YdiL (CAAX protease family)